MTTDFVYRVRVDYSTHDDLKDGIVVLGSQFVAVLARNGRDAQLVAAQMVSCRSLPDSRTAPTRRVPDPQVSVMVTGTVLLD